jgi:hypothetical protein
MGSFGSDEGILKVMCAQTHYDHFKASTIITSEEIRATIWLHETLKPN